MNEILQNYYIEDTLINGDEKINIPIIERKVYVKKNAIKISYGKLYEALRIQPFLRIHLIGEMLDIMPEEDEEPDMSLFELLNYFEINYEPIIRKRLLISGYSKAKIIELLIESTRPESTFLPDIYCQWLESEKFVRNWKFLRTIIPEYVYLLEFYGIEHIDFNGGYEEDEGWISVELGDYIEIKDKVLKFENFNS